MGYALKKEGKMIKRIVLMLAVIAILAAPMAQAKELVGVMWISKGMLDNAHKYLQYDQHARLAYVTGIIDALGMAMVLEADYVHVMWVQYFLQGKTDVQIEAMFYKWVQEHPQDWHHGANMMFYDMMRSHYPWKNFNEQHGKRLRKEIEALERQEGVKK